MSWQRLMTRAAAAAAAASLSRHVCVVAVESPAMYTLARARADNNVGFGGLQVFTPCFGWITTF